MYVCTVCVCACVHICTRLNVCFNVKVGGDFYDAVIPLMNKNGRVAIVGNMSEYNKENPEKGKMI